MADAATNRSKVASTLHLLWQAVDLNDNEFSARYHNHRTLRLHTLRGVPEEVFAIVVNKNVKKTVAGVREFCKLYSWISREKFATPSLLLDYSVARMYCAGGGAAAGTLQLSANTLSYHDTSPAHLEAVRKSQASMRQADLVEAGAVLVDTPERRAMSEETVRDLLFIREKWRLVEELVDRRAAELQEAPHLKSKKRKAEEAAAQASAVAEARKTARLADARAFASNASGSSLRSRMHAGAADAALAAIVVDAESDVSSTA